MDDDYDGGTCEKCGGEGFLEWFEHPELWGSDLHGDGLENHLVTCDECRGAGGIDRGDVCPEPLRAAFNDSPETEIVQSALKRLGDDQCPDQKSGISE